LHSPLALTLLLDTCPLHFVSYLDNGVMTTPKRRLLSFVFACLCFSKPLLSLLMMWKRYEINFGKYRTQIKSICKLVLALTLIQLTGAFLPFRQVRKCVPKFLTLIMIFLYLTVCDTEEKENSFLPHLISFSFSDTTKYLVMKGYVVSVIVTKLKMKLIFY